MKNHPRFTGKQKKFKKQILLLKIQRQLRSVVLRIGTVTVATNSYGNGQCNRFSDHKFETGNSVVCNSDYFILKPLVAKNFSNL